MRNQALLYFMKMSIAIAALSLYIPVSAKAQEEQRANLSSVNDDALKADSIDFSKDIGPDYTPLYDDEKELWNQADKLEINFLRNSSKIIDDPTLNAYVRSVLCKTIGEDKCAPIRLYLVRTTQFNALMAPNGMMQVWSGLLVRMENEAQLASILAHEYSHYVRRHSLQSQRLAQNLEWTSVVPYVGIIASVGAVGSIFAFSREMEKEADQLSLEYIHQAGYDPRSSSAVWKQLNAEFEVTKPKRKEKNIFDNFFSTHPNSKDRMKVLAEMAETKAIDVDAKNNREAYRKALGEWWSIFINDQIIAKDFKTGEYLIDQLAKEGWNSELYFAKAELYRKRGENGDYKLAVDHYQKSIDAGSQKAENWRGLGLSLFRENERDKAMKALKEYLRRVPDAVDKKMIQLLTGLKPNTEIQED